MEKAKSIYSEFIDREEIDKHHSYSDELRLCAAMQAAHPSVLEIARTLFHAEHAGLLSEDPLTNLKYLFCRQRHPYHPLLYRRRPVPAACLYDQ